MKIAGSALLHADPERIWAAITDPAVLATVIPGCEVLTPIEDEPVRADRHASGSPRSRARTPVRCPSPILEPPTSLTMRANGSGAPGTIDTTVRGHADRATGRHHQGRLRRRRRGRRHGRRGRAAGAGRGGQEDRGLFFAAIDDVLTGARAALPEAASAAVAQVAVGGRPVPLPGAMPAARPGGLSLIGAAAFGAISMLIGVLVGARIARRR